MMKYYYIQHPVQIKDDHGQYLRVSPKKLVVAGNVYADTPRSEAIRYTRLFKSYEIACRYARKKQTKLKDERFDYPIFEVEYPKHAKKKTSFSAKGPLKPLSGSLKHVNNKYKKIDISNISFSNDQTLRVMKGLKRPGKFTFSRKIKFLDFIKKNAWYFSLGAFALGIVGFVASGGGVPFLFISALGLNALKYKIPAPTQKAEYKESLKTKELAFWSQKGKASQNLGKKFQSLELELENLVTHAEQANFDDKGSFSKKQPKTDLLKVYKFGAKSLARFNDAEPKDRKEIRQEIHKEIKKKDFKIRSY